MVGIRCNEPAPGYFLAPLDFYLYEAENAAPLDTKCSSDLVGDPNGNWLYFYYCELPIVSHRAWPLEFWLKFIMYGSHKAYSRLSYFMIGKHNKNYTYVS